jgi:hypothetical protein
MTNPYAPTEKVRAGEPSYYWFHAFNGYPEFFWDDWEVSEAEYRRNAPRNDVAYLDRILRGHSTTARSSSF